MLSFDFITCVVAVYYKWIKGEIHWYKGTNTVSDGDPTEAGELGSAHRECMRETWDLVVPKYKYGGRRSIVVYYESMNRKLIKNPYISVGVMEDYKLRDLRASHTLGWSWNWKT